MLWTLVVILVVGLIAGFVARLLVPGDDPMGVGGTLVLGLVGSFVGGFLGWLIFRNDAQDGAFQVSGLLGSIIGAVIALIVFRLASGRRVSGKRV